MSGSVSRTAARELALQALYAIDQSNARRGEAASSEPAAAGVFDAVAASFEVPAAGLDFARELVLGTCAARADLDARIGRLARNWRIERMAVVDRNVLRLAAFELERGTAPVSVVIDEAIELARRFGSDQSPAFVNGILDALARGGDPGAEPPKAALDG